MTRPRGGIIAGTLPAWTTTSTSGVFTLREAQELRAANTWPRGPVAPTSLSASAGSGQLSLNWTAPATTHGTITNYLVEYTPSGGSPQYVLTGSTSTSYTLTGLTNGTAYTVRVAAVNFTAGDYSNAVTGTPNARVITGGTVTTPGDGYTYHTFTSNGDFVVSNTSLLCDILVVGGGARGGTNFNAGGGGGGGGVLLSSAQTLAVGTYPVVVGASALTDNGNSSSISTYSASGGLVGANGSGSGGGNGGSSGLPTSSSASVRNSGGARLEGANEDNETGGGGGGAGGAGQNAGGPNNPGLGGAGRTVFGVTYGAGGRGGCSQCGSTPIHGAANTGNGGSGGETGSSRGNGGSGIVVIRYL